MSRRGGGVGGGGGQGREREATGAVAGDEERSPEMEGLGRRSRRLRRQIWWCGGLDRASCVEAGLVGRYVERVIAMAHFLDVRHKHQDSNGALFRGAPLTSAAGIG